MNDPQNLSVVDAEPSITNETDRRAMIKTAAALALVGVTTSAAASSDTTAVRGNGKPGDFGFLAGEWKIKNRRLKDKDRSQWDEFEGEATCWTILNGVGSVEELRIPARDFAGMGLRLLDIQRGVWNDFWVNAKNPVLTTPGLEGSFENGVGTFVAEEKEADRTIVVKGVWDRITPDSCRWYQATSADGGKTWEENWTMVWTRAKKPETK
jgi:hypothetical protein